MKGDEKMKTAEEIYSEMKNVFYEESGHSVADDCDMGVRLYAAAVQAEALYYYGQWVTRQAYPQTAEGEYLDNHGSMRGLMRKAAVKAVGDISFYITNTADYDIEVPMGTVCADAAGFAFITAEDGKISAGETLCTVKCEAVEAGKAGNVPSDTVIFMTHAPVGIEGCVNTAAFTGGADTEDDESFRERILESYKNAPNGANAAWYKDTALSVKGVSAASVVPCADGAGTVDVTVVSGDMTADAALLKAVSDAFEGKRELGIEVNVKAPAVLRVNVSAEIKVKAGFEAENVLKAVENEILSVFKPALLGKNLYISDFAAAIMKTQGVESYHITAPTSDILASASVLPAAGEISVGRWY